MKNVDLELAKFGDKFRTRGSVHLPIVFLNEEDGIYKFVDSNGIVLSYTGAFRTPIGYPERHDLEIISPWGIIDNEKDRMDFNTHLQTTGAEIAEKIGAHYILYGYILSKKELDYLEQYVFHAFANGFAHGYNTRVHETTYQPSK